MREGLLEVETPLLRSATTTDPYINHLQVSHLNQTFFLQSSPEHAMKYLLARGSGSIFQICKAFRGEELGKYHRSEFTMLEWYVLDWSSEDLLNQTIRLLKSLITFTSIDRISYRECFEKFLGINPFDISLNELKKQTGEYVDVENIAGFSFDECLHLLFSAKIESQFLKENITVVFDFPESQAALSALEVDADGNVIAKRFEIYFGGLELANAYQEEQSEKLLRSRFKQENGIRSELGKNVVPIDEELLSAMAKGLPACSGIALGLDRLLMLRLGQDDIKKVLSV